MLAQAAHETFGRSQLVQREAERRAELAAEKHQRSREHLSKQLAGLRERHRALAAAARGKGSPSPPKDLHMKETKGSERPKDRPLEQVEGAMRAKLAELDAMPLQLSKPERQRVRAAFVASVEAATSLAASVASVEVRRNNLVFHKK